MIFSYIYDFVSTLFEQEIRKDIKNIILYGSVASGESDEESDIDIFVDVWEKKKKTLVEKKVKEQLNKFEDRAARVWHPRGIKNNFSVVVGSLDDERWSKIVYDMVSNGVFLYGKFEAQGQKLRHSVLITFALNKMQQKDKMKFIRGMYGYSLKKNSKKYDITGFIQKSGGEKISSNSIMIPIEKYKEFKKEFSKFRISPEIREMWSR